MHAHRMYNVSATMYSTVEVHVGWVEGTAVGDDYAWHTLQWGQVRELLSVRGTQAG